jgi:hypothetical protein
MKKISKFILLSGLIATIIVSCKKDENRIYFEGGTPPALSSSITGNISLSFVNKDNVALKLMWTDPDYKFTTGLSSQDVTYLIEIDTTGASFTNPKRQTVSVSKEMSKTFTQGELNDFLLNQLQLVPGMSHNIEMRVKSTLTNNNAILNSNVLKFTVTPFPIPPKVAPPTTNKLYIVGSATNGDWNNPVPVPSQEFTKISNTLYEITLPLKGGAFYLLLPLNGDWGTKYGALGGNGSNNPNGDDFRMGGGDLIAPAVTGTYKISVDFQRGKYAVTKI